VPASAVECREGDGIGNRKSWDELARNARYSYSDGTCAWVGDSPRSDRLAAGLASAVGDHSLGDHVLWRSPAAPPVAPPAVQRFDEMADKQHTDDRNTPRNPATALRRLGWARSKPQTHSHVTWARKVQKPWKHLIHFLHSGSGLLPSTGDQSEPHGVRHTGFERGKLRLWRPVLVTRAQGGYGRWRRVRTWTRRRVSTWKISGAQGTFTGERTDGKRMQREGYKGDQASDDSPAGYRLRVMDIGCHGRAAAAHGVRERARGSRAL
jgi:hypothetical protein